MNEQKKRSAPAGTRYAHNGMDTQVYHGHRRLSSAGIAVIGIVIGLILGILATSAIGAAIHRFESNPHGAVQMEWRVER